MKPLSILAALVGCLLFLAPDFSDARPRRPAPRPVPTWTVLPGSSLGFTTAMNGERFSGQFRRWTASIRFDPGNLAGSKVDVTIDMTSAATGNPDRDAALPDTTWFAASRFQQASFHAEHFRNLGPDRYAADGVLTLRGVAKPLTLPFSLAITGVNARMTAQVGVNRLAFGVGQGEWASTEVVPSTVTVTVALNAKKAS